MEVLERHLAEGGEPVDAGIAHDDVVQGIAAAVDIARAFEIEIFQICAQRERHGALHHIIAAACTLGLAACGGGTPEPADPVTVTAHADVRFTHGLCPDCLTTLYPEFTGEAGEPGAGSS